MEAVLSYLGHARPLRQIWIATLVCFVVLAGAAQPLSFAAGPQSQSEPHRFSAPHPQKKDKCPVCGMFVYRYPDFLASVTFADHHSVFFDGVKDLFKYLFQLSTYDPGRTRDSIAIIHVTEYYDMQPVKAKKAVYVMGSDVLGPMGHELIPFQSTEDAQQFLIDHKGKRILRFHEVTPSVINLLD